VAANQLKREHMNSLAASLYMEGSESEKLVGLQEKLGFQKQISFRWQIATLLLVLIVLTFILTKQYAQRQAENAMRVALQKAASERQSILDVSSKLEITKEDIRKIHMGLTKGHQIGEALLSLQKVEVLHKHTSAAPKALDSINGITDLSESEFTILQLSLDGISNKEIAHQLEVSSGYVYNSRSAIRKKLDIPKESSIRQWIQKQTS
jgi:DNA-binding CsgD family transcriptional regulator